MSNAALNYVWEKAPADLDPTAMLVLVALADRADAAGSSHYAAATLAQRCRISDRQVRTWLHRLRDIGLIRIDERAGRTSLVSIVLPDAEPLKPASPLKPTAGVKPTSAHPGSPLQPTPEAHFSPPLKPTADDPSRDLSDPSSIHPAVDHSLIRTVTGAGWTDEAIAAGVAAARERAAALQLHIDPVAVVAGLSRSTRTPAAVIRRHDATELRRHATEGARNLSAHERSTRPRTKCRLHAFEDEPCRACAADRKAGLTTEIPA